MATPTSTRPTLPNTALTGAEIKSLMRTDFETLMDNHGVLASGAFGRVSYELVIRLHVDNPYLTPEALNVSMKSKFVGRNVIEKDPPLAAIETPPLVDPSPLAAIESKTLTRDIVSPNIERVRTGLPVPALVPQQDGTMAQETVKYPAQPNIQGASARITDTVTGAEVAFGVTPDAPPTTILSDEESAKLAAKPAEKRDFYGHPQGESE